MVPKFIDLSKHRYLLLQAAEPKIIARITMVATSRHPIFPKPFKLEPRPEKKDQNVS
jgi:hypothetical protein